MYAILTHIHLCWHLICTSFYLDCVTLSFAFMTSHEWCHESHQVKAFWGVVYLIRMSGLLLVSNSTVPTSCLSYIVRQDAPTFLFSPLEQVFSTQDHAMSFQEALHDKRSDTFLTVFVPLNCSISSLTEHNEGICSLFVPVRSPESIYLPVLLMWICTADL